MSEEVKDDIDNGIQNEDHVLESSDFKESDPSEDISEKYDYDMYMNSCIPKEIDRFLDFLSVNSGGKLLLGSSDLNSRYWGGTITYYNDPLGAPHIENCKSGFILSGGTPDGTFVTNNRAVVAEDGGKLNFIAVNEDEVSPSMYKNHIEDCSSSIMKVQVTCDRKTILTASKDLSIRTYDSESTSSQLVFAPAHGNELTSISPHSNNPSLFLSSGLDGNVLLWDTRLPIPAQCLFRDINDPPMEVCWAGNDPDTFLVGTYSGSICLRTASNVSFNLTSLEAFCKPIHRFRLNPYNRNEVACLAKSTKMSMIAVDKQKLAVVYEDERHQDFVRDCGWLGENDFITCGWDKQIISHKST